MKIDILIFGMGNMGKRHLQGISPLDCYRNIYGFDVSKESLNSVDQFCSENNIDKTSLMLIDDFDMMMPKINKGSIVIVATTAKGRVELLKSIIARRPRAIIVEKPLCQNEKEYKRILGMSEKYGVPVYVDFHRHMYPVYQGLLKELKDLKKKSFHIKIWGGMACVGIHGLDLMTWLLKIKKYKIIYSSCSSAYKAKRRGFFDFAGEVVFVADDNVICSLSVTKDKSLQTFEISTEDKQYRINESMGEMTVTEGMTSEKGQKIEILFVSQIIGPVIKDILRGPSFVRLANIQQCYLAHRILFDFIKIHNKEEVNIT